MPTRSAAEETLKAHPAVLDALVVGVPDDICAQVDPVTLFTLVATAEALVSAGLTMPAQREGPSHKRLRPLIETSIPNMDHPKRVALSRLVGRLYTLRIDADYKPSVLVEDKESREAVSIMKTIFEAF